MILLTQFQHLYRMTKCIFFLVDQLCPLEIMVTENSQYAMNVTHTHTFNGPFSGTTRVSRYQKGKTNLDFSEARDSEWHWHQLGHMQVCISLQTDNHASTPPLKFCTGGCPSCRPTNSVKALKAQCYECYCSWITVDYRQQFWCCALAPETFLGSWGWQSVGRDSDLHSPSVVDCQIVYQHQSTFLLGLRSVMYKSCQNVESTLAQDLAGRQPLFKKTLVWGSKCGEAICSSPVLATSGRKVIVRRNL